VAVVVAIGVPVFLLGGGDRPPVDVATTVPPDTPTTVPSDTSTTLTTVLTSAPVPEVWGPVAFGTSTQHLGDIAEMPGGGLAAVGGDDDLDSWTIHAAVYLASDYLTWEQVGADHPALTTGMNVATASVTAAGPGLLVGGFSCKADDPSTCSAHPTIWTTTDGSDWTRTGPDPEAFPESGVVQALLDSPHGILAGGIIWGDGDDDDLANRPAVWMSHDAVTWERVWFGDARGGLIPAGFPFGIEDFVAGPDGLVVAVGSGGNAEGEIVAAVWTSDDGSTWNRAAADDPVFGSEGGFSVAMNGVTYGEEGFVAVGTEGGSDVAIWRSSNGTEWTRVAAPLETFGGTGSLTDVARLPSGFIAVGERGLRTGGVRAWTSPDGVAWDRVLDLARGDANSVVVTESFAAIAGVGASSDPASNVLVWAGPIPDATDPRPDPVPPGEEHEPIAAPSDIQSVPEGVSCARLAEAGYSYPEVVAYWMRWERPEDSQPDEIAAPCADHFATEDVEAVYQPDDSLEVRFVPRLGETFTASGPAVDAGLICPSGTVAFLTFSDSSVGLPGSLQRVEDEYTCDDGTGTFILGADVFIILLDGGGSAQVIEEGGEFGTWRIVSGTGRYEGLAGGGGWLSWWGEVLEGRLRIQLDQPDG
jgi:hypothetical protein